MAIDCLFASMFTSSVVKEFASHVTDNLDNRGNKFYVGMDKKDTESRDRID